jgi:hypothetical protein
VRTALAFVAGFLVGWQLLAWAARRVIAERPTYSGTISSPEGEWTFSGANISHSPWNR